MPSCCVPGCYNHHRKKKKVEAELGIKSELSFHHFPPSKETRKKWIQAIRRDEGPNFKVTKCTSVCSTHFTKDSFKWVPNGPSRLKKGAVPSIFDWTKPSKPRNPPKDRTPLSPLAPTPTSNCAETPCYAETEVLGSTSPQDHLGSVSLSMHDYDVKPYTIAEKLRAATERIRELEAELVTHRARLKSQQPFGWERVSGNDKQVRSYTGFHSAQSFDIFFDTILPHSVNMQAYTERQQGMTADKAKDLIESGQKLPLKSQFFLFMHKMKLGSWDQELADKFNVSLATVRSITITWANFLCCVLGSMKIWPTKEDQEAFFPPTFPAHYKNLRVILDCFELKIQAPSSVPLDCELSLGDEAPTTLKSLIGITAWGAVSFVSNLYCGSISDIQLTKESGLLNLLDEGDGVMAEEAFDMGELLKEKGCKLVVPHFLERKPTIKPTEFSYVCGRAFERVTKFRIFDRVLPHELSPTINQLWAVGCMLTNFQGPLSRNAANGQP